jgi:hypothetical protein
MYSAIIAHEQADLLIHSNRYRCAGQLPSAEIGEIQECIVGIVEWRQGQKGDEEGGWTENVRNAGYDLEDR